MRERLRREREGARSLRPEAGAFDDKLRGNAREFFGLFRREAFAVGGVLFKAVRPLRDEFLVVEVFLDENADHARDECGVGADAGLQVDVGDFGGLRAARVDRDDLAAALLRGLNGLPPAHGLRPDVRGENEVDLGVGRGRAPVVGHAEVEFFGHHAARAAADRRFRTPGDGTEVAREAIDGGTRFLRVARVEHHAVGTVLLARGEHVGGDLLVGFVPGDAHPARIGGALGVRALHRVEETVWIVEALQGRPALGAEPVVGIFLPVVDAVDDVSFRFEANAAGWHVVAGVANRKARPGFFGGGAVGLRKDRRGGGKRRGKRAGAQKRAS